MVITERGRSRDVAKDQQQEAAQLKRKRDDARPIAMRHIKSQRDGR